MKQNKLIKESGPYYVESHSQGSGMVYLQVYPAFPEYDDDNFLWAESRFNMEGGGPSMFSSMAIAAELDDFLNSVYHQREIENWKDRIKALKKVEQNKWKFVTCHTCGHLSSVTLDWKYCPICGNAYEN
jgi:rubrerythrin